MSSYADFMRHAHDTKAAKPKCETCTGSGKIRAGHVTCPDCGGDGIAKTSKAVDQHQETLDALARMRLTLKTAKVRDQKTANSHRDGTGQFTKAAVPHAANAFDMRRHLQQDHGVAQSVLAPLIGTSLHIYHDTAHAAGGADHALEEQSVEVKP